MDRSVALELLQRGRGNWRPTDYSVRHEIEAESVLVATDLHIPYHDEQMIARMLERAYAEKVEALWLGGDVLDMPYYSKWDRVDLSATLERDFSMLRAFMDAASQVFPVVYYTPGNHEWRYLRRLDWQTGLEGLARQAGLDEYIEEGRLRVYDDPTITFLNGSWMFTHPAKYGKQPLVIPGLIADTYGVNLVSAHAHHFGMGVSPSGKHWVVESGGLFKPEYHEYKQRNINDLRPWVQGYWIIRKDSPVPIPGR